MRQIVLIIHNIRSIHNVGSMMRTADSFGVKQIIFSGYTPYPKVKNDKRLPHISQKMTASIAKTALGAESYVPYAYEDDLMISIQKLKTSGYQIVGLEQDFSSTAISDYVPSNKTAVIIGEEVEGISTELLAHCDKLVEIPMHGKKESLNVSVATGIFLYHICSAK